MSGIRGLLLALVAAVALVIALGGVESASAHKANWCKHSDRIGARWWTFYAGHYWLSAPYETYYHYHTTRHYYGPSAGSFHKYKHVAKKVCVIAGGRPAATVVAPQEPDSALTAPLAVWCPQPRVRMGPPEDGDPGCESPPAEEEVPVEATPGLSEDPSDYGAPSGTQSSVMSQALESKRVTVRWTVIEPGIDGRLRARTISRQHAGACVTALTDRRGRSQLLSALPDARVLEIETASSSLARSLGHPCL